MEKINKQIMSYLVEKGIIPQGDMEKVFPSGQPAEDSPLEEQLVGNGLLSLPKLRATLEGFFGTPFATEDASPRAGYHHPWPRGP